jgi:hypothetical protein
MNDKKPLKRQMHVGLIILIDVLITAACLGLFTWVHLGMPQPMSKDLSKSPRRRLPLHNAWTTAGSSAAPSPSSVTDDGWGAKFRTSSHDGEVQKTDTTYKSRDVNVTLNEHEENGVTYFVEDIYIRNIENFRTAFADDTFGKSIYGWTLDIARRTTL